MCGLKLSKEKDGKMCELYLQWVVLSIVFILWDVKNFAALQDLSFLVLLKYFLFSLREEGFKLVSFVIAAEPRFY